MEGVSFITYFRAFQNSGVWTMSCSNLTHTNFMFAAKAWELILLKHNVSLELIWKI